MSSFGFGQRQCLGMTLTQDELFISCGNLLWSFNMTKKIDPKTGAEIEAPLDKSNTLLIIKPDPWQMAFHVRSEERKQKILDDWRIAEAKENEDRAAFNKAAEKARSEGVTA